MNTTSTRAALLGLALCLGGCGFGLPELLIILAIVLLLFGATKLPALARSAGEALGSFRDGMKTKGEPKSIAAPQEDASAEDAPPKDEESARKAG